VCVCVCVCVCYAHICRPPHYGKIVMNSKLAPDQFSSSVKNK